ncbi:MAG TPA: hypothetical protein IAB38_03005 [Candidatus Onthousia excrementipullorum]|uniref:Transposase n=1 Tax=Candidatus Onthousia excrementipullorum TaxID=2840884 RepID=A0A9D1DU49_9FIRM|nr:hypothetical protein [Candidatus Onthousia excrementipullorum]
MNFSGENYDDSYIGIQINFDLDWQYDDRDIIKFVLMDPERGIVLSENLIIYNINLLKFREKYYNNDELSEFERAITLLTLNKREDLEKISEEVEGLMEAKEEDKKNFEKEKEELAKRMLDMDLSNSDIIKTTGLSKKQIQELKNS